MTPTDYAEIVSSLDCYWGGRDLRALHHPMFIHEFGETALVVRSGVVAAYLFGFVAGEVGYVHLVGVRDGFRRRGLASLLYEAFATLARKRGAARLKAITTPGNEGSIAFHRALGMTAELVPDYAGPGADRVVLRMTV
jgi:GNAT superfamily N-acetyltransferase